MVQKFIDDPELIEEKQKTFRAAGLVLFIGALGLVAMRLIINLVSGYIYGALEEAYAELVIEAIFDVGVQVVILLGVTLAVSGFYLKNTPKQVLAVNNVRKVGWQVCLIAVAIGLFAPFMSYIANIASNLILGMLGAKLPSGASVYPKEFSVWVMLAYIFLIGVLPAVCEEFFNRGVVLTAMRASFPEWATILLGGLLFGLFHQSIHQTLYTGLFGFVMVFVALKTRSIVPTMIVHFVNNALSVVGDFASYYNWDFFSVYTLIQKLIDYPALLFLALFAGCGFLVFLLWLLAKAAKRDREKAILKKLNLPPSLAKNASVDVVGGPLNDATAYKTTPADRVFWFAAMAVGVASTIFSLIMNMF